MNDNGVQKFPPLLSPPIHFCVDLLSHKKSVCFVSGIFEDAKWVPCFFSTNDQHSVLEIVLRFISDLNSDDPVGCGLLSFLAAGGLFLLG